MEALYSHLVLIEKRVKSVTYLSAALEVKHNSLNSTINVWFLTTVILTVNAYLFLLVVHPSTKVWDVVPLTSLVVQKVREEFSPWDDVYSFPVSNLLARQHGYSSVLKVEPEAC